MRVHPRRRRCPAVTLEMSALTEVSEADELKAAVAATGEPRLIALLERLAVVEGKLADGSGDLRAGHRCVDSADEQRPSRQDAPRGAADAARGRRGRGRRAEQG